MMKILSVYFCGDDGYDGPWIHRSLKNDKIIVEEGIVVGVGDSDHHPDYHALSLGCFGFDGGESS